MSRPPPWVGTRCACVPGCCSCPVPGTADQHGVGPDDMPKRYLTSIDQLRECSAVNGDDVFVNHVRLVQPWRRFPLLDPELLDQHWPGRRADATSMTATTSGIASHKGGNRMDDEASLRHWPDPASLASRTPAPHKKLRSVETSGCGYARRPRGEVKVKQVAAPSARVISGNRRRSPMGRIRVPRREHDGSQHRRARAGAPPTGARQPAHHGGRTGRRGRVSL